jgi:hypothetical protein
MEAETLLESPIVIGALVLIGLVVVLKLLGLATKIVAFLVVLGALGFAYYLYATGAFG